MTTHRNLALTLTVAAFALLSAGTALADDPTPDNYAQVPSQKTRAQVANELTQARQDGSAKVWSFSYQNKLQNQVHRSARAPRSSPKCWPRAASGELNAFVGEDSGSFYLSRQAAKNVRPFHRVTAE